MATFLLILHIIVSFLLIFIVLIQGGKGAEMGAAFGGGSGQTLFGSRGTTSFLSKMTTGIAVLFMVTSLMLAIVNVKGKDGSVVKTPASQGAVPTGAVPTGTSSPIPPESTPAPAQTPAGQ